MSEGKITVDVKSEDVKGLAEVVSDISEKSGSEYPHAYALHMQIVTLCIYSYWSGFKVDDLLNNVKQAYENVAEAGAMFDPEEVEGSEDA